jgi:hypothetical protein
MSDAKRLTELVVPDGSHGLAVGLNSVSLLGSGVLGLMARVRKIA